MTQTQPQVKQWEGSPITTCNLCGCKLEVAFVDGATIMGPWGIFCLSCYGKVGMGFGKGLGQLYAYQGNVWIKVRG